MSTLIDGSKRPKDGVSLLFDGNTRNRSRVLWREIVVLYDCAKLSDN